MRIDATQIGADQHVGSQGGMLGRAAHVAKNIVGKSSELVFGKSDKVHFNILIVIANPLPWLSELRGGAISVDKLLRRPSSQ